MNSPAIRFAGFAEDWEERKLGDVAEFNPKAVLPNTFEYVDLESVVGTELIGHRTESRATAPSRAQRLAQRGDVFYQTVRPYQKNNYIFTLPYCDYVFSTGYAQMRPSISSSFLFSRLQGDSFVKTVLDRCTGTSYPAINATDLSEVKIMMPDDEVEQAKIGATFCKLDRLITLHQREHDKTVNIKKALLEKMFPKDGEDKPEIRFAGFTGAWERRDIGACFSERNERSGTGDLISVTMNSGVMRAEDLGRHDTSSNDKSNYKKVEVGDIAYNSMRMWQGASGYSPYSGILSPAYTVIIPQEGMHSPFFAYLFKRSNMIHQFQMNSQGLTSDTWNLKWPSLRTICVIIPEFEEQRRISELFAGIDRLITIHQCELTKLQNIKKALLEKMFV